MKKVYTTIILFVSLFFFCSHNANAATYSYPLLEDEFNLLNSEFFEVKEIASQYCIDNNMDHYVIGYNKTSNYYIFAILRNPLTQTFKKQTLFYKGIIEGPYSDYPVYRYTYINGVVSSPDKHYQRGFELRASTSYNDNYISLVEYLYSTYPFINTLADDIVINYNDYSYTVESGGKFLSLYEHYLNINGLTDEDLIPDIHKDEKEIISNFYTLVIEKIDLLADSIINNYIYLTVIGIFILIFVICLIRRYLL